jgi:hypothetical protein
MTEDLQTKYADKIAKLLAKAQDKAASPNEQDAFLAKAQELMTRYAIDEAMVQAAMGEEREEIVKEEITYKGVYAMELMGIGATIAKAQGARIYYSRGAKSTVHLHMVGFKKDLDRARMLDASVQIQATAQQMKWARDPENPGIKSWMSPMDKFKARRQFLIGYNAGLSSVLYEARKAAEAAAKREAAESIVGNDATREQDQKDASESVALVIRNRKQQVNDYFDETYGRGLRKVSRRYSSGGYDANNAGAAAGRRADLSTGHKVGGNQRSLTS